MNKEFNLEEAEEFIDNIYQHKFDNMEEILEDGTKVVHLGGLDDIKFTDFESASFTLLRGEQRLKYQIKKQKEVIDKAIKLIKYNEKYRDGAGCCQFVDIVSEILDPLQSILEKDETTNNAYLKEFEDWLKEVSE